MLLARPPWPRAASAHPPVLFLCLSNHSLRRLRAIRVFVLAFHNALSVHVQRGRLLRPAALFGSTRPQQKQPYISTVVTGSTVANDQRTLPVLAPSLPLESRLRFSRVAKHNYFFGLSETQVAITASNIERVCVSFNRWSQSRDDMYIRGPPSSSRTSLLDTIAIIQGSCLRGSP
jgi:hypothetical protein